ncbi:hypothetical protein [Streptomyces sp. NPDC127066]|uniref:hypothetical protein n=1 Tax=Streptomyces sp. NPDC127066 TaxID=3347125 RepID=UPI00364ACFE3
MRTCCARASAPRNHSDRILLPGPGVGAEAENVGTAIDCPLRLAFTTAVPVDPAARAGITLTGTYDSDASQRRRRVGEGRRHGEIDLREPAQCVHDRFFQEPIRVRQDGTWMPIDTTLADTGAAVTPGATVADLNLSDGGTGPGRRLGYLLLV